MAYFKQFFNLTKKNFILAKRNYLWTTIDILLPSLITLVLLVLRIQNPIQNIPQTTFLQN